MNAISLEDKIIYKELFLYGNYYLHINREWGLYREISN